MQELPRLLPALPRAFASTAHLVPQFVGGKVKPYTSYKERFKVSSGGKIIYQRPGHVKKRFNKSQRQLLQLSKQQSLHDAYAKVMKKLGFHLRA